jgi:hypothetical protein
MKTLNLNELDILYRRITALELIERFKNCGLIWQQVSPWAYTLTYKYEGDIWDITFTRDVTHNVSHFMEFNRNGFYYITLSSIEDVDLVSFWNEMEDYNNFEKDKLLLRDLTKMKDCRDTKVYNYNPIGFGVLGAGTGIQELQVPWKPRNVVASQASVWDSTIQETLDVVPGYTFASLQWDVPFFDGGRPIYNYLVQGSLDGFSWYDPFLAFGWNFETNFFNEAPPTATFRNVLGLLTASSNIFRVAALNEIGLSDWAYSNSPCLTAAKPVNLTATQTGTGEITLSWQEQNSGPCEVVGHGIRYWKDGVAQGWAPLGETILGTTAIITGLTTGSRYEFKVGTIIGTIIGPMSAKSSSVILV